MCESSEINAPHCVKIKVCVCIHEVRLLKTIIQYPFDVHSLLVISLNPSLTNNVEQDCVLEYSHSQQESESHLNHFNTHRN